MSQKSDFCPSCQKQRTLCFCDDLKSQSVSQKITLLILQHPQEPKEPLGTARLTHLLFTNSILKTGLSWPNLEKTLGRKADPKKWAVLYLGSAKVPSLTPDQSLDAPHIGARLFRADKKGEVTTLSPETKTALEGLIVLDGTWSQAKTLWWRNAWLTKLTRLVLAPQKASAYGKFRKEPRRESLSTLESTGLTLSLLEDAPRYETLSHETLKTLITRYQHAKTT